MKSRQKEEGKKTLRVKVHGGPGLGLEAEWGGGGDGGRGRKCEARGCVERKLHQITSIQGMRVPDGRCK